MHRIKLKTLLFAAFMLVSIAATPAVAVMLDDNGCGCTERCWPDGPWFEEKPWPGEVRPLSFWPAGPWPGGYPWPQDFQPLCPVALPHWLCDIVPV